MVVVVVGQERDWSESPATSICVERFMGAIRVQEYANSLLAVPLKVV